MSKKLIILLTRGAIQPMRMPATSRKIPKAEKMMPIWCIDRDRHLYLFMLPRLHKSNALFSFRFHIEVYQAKLGYE